MIDNFITQFLGIELTNNGFIFADLWSFIHIFSGVIIILILSLFIKKTYQRLSILFGLLIVWEIFEFILYGVISPPLISFENYVDLISDLFFGMFGGIIVEIFLFLKKK